MVTESGLKIIDLGLSVMLTKQRYARWTKAPTGFRNNRAPEVIKGGPHSLETDIWGIGCLMYEIASGRLIWDE